jgi:hypothetical protein
MEQRVKYTMLWIVAVSFGDLPINHFCEVETRGR